uniref:Uncharacterized protein n=1 Tax=Arundo donax TaxID=35708 RepID=A0A0A8ZMU9_ARUDO
MVDARAGARRSDSAVLHINTVRANSSA